MSSEFERSQQVVDNYKKRKLAHSAFFRIREIIHGFEQERVADRRMAQIGIALILLILAIAAYLFFVGDDSIIS